MVQSHRGPYTVTFDDEALARLDAAVPASAHFVVDAAVAALHEREIKNVLGAPSVLRIEATESSKSLDRFSAYVEHLVARGVRRGHTLVAIGGGVVQDIVCFLATTLLRGLEWNFYPTTLLAQADSCIGSKSSINVGTLKNVLGTFTPPSRIVISTGVLATLAERDVRSGIGEMLKAHAIDGPGSFDAIAADYSRLRRDAATLRRYLRRSLEIKKALVEKDEFDQGPRQVMNYGHTFGHALESATDFAIAHGIAVTIGMDMANYTALRLGLMAERHYKRMHPTLAENYAGFEKVDVPLARFLDALGKDKKNRATDLCLILPDADARPSRGFYANDEVFRAICAEYLTVERARGGDTAAARGSRAS